MGTKSTGLTLPPCSRSPIQHFIPPLSNSKVVASAMSPSGGARVGDGGGGGGGKRKPTPGPGAHPRYVPKRGSVLKGIVRGMLGITATLLVGAPASSGGHRVRPAPPAPGEGGGGDHGHGAEQGK